MSIGCVPPLNFMLFDFQGHVLDLGSSKNPINSFTRNVPDSPNQQWSLSVPVPDFPTTLVSSVSTTSGQDIVLGWDTAHGRTTSSLQQALGVPSGTLPDQIMVTCINATSAFILDTSNNFMLTAWQTVAMSSSSPVTFEPSTGRAEQAWTFEALD